MEMNEAISAMNQLQPEHIEENPGLGTVLGYFQKKYGPAFFPMPLETKPDLLPGVPEPGDVLP